MISLCNVYMILFQYFAFLNDIINGKKTIGNVLSFRK